MSTPLGNAVRSLIQVQRKYHLTNDQMELLYKSNQLDNIVKAVELPRWDQVVLMLIQEKVLEKWPS